MLSCVRLSETPWTAAHQAPLSMDPSGENTRVGCHALLRGIFPTQGSNLCLLYLPALAGGFFTTSTNWEAPFYTASPANGLPIPQPPGLTRASLIFRYSCWKLRNHLVIFNTPVLHPCICPHSFLILSKLFLRVTSLFHAHDGAYSPPSSGDPPLTPGQTRSPFMPY